MPCSITPTQPRVCTVMYTPTTHGPHQLRIKIKDSDIQGSPFKVDVLPEAVSGTVRPIITEVESPRSVAVSNSGDVVISHDWGKQCDISVFTRKGEKKVLFRADGESSRHVAFSADNHILAVNINSNQVTKYTMEGKLVKSVTCSMKPPHPSSITVHPSGKVVVAGSDCKRIEVFNPDLTQSHLFSIHIDGDKTDDFRFPLVACDNDGVVYVAGKHCIRPYDNWWPVHQQRFLQFY